MAEEDMSLQLSMALSGINSEEWKEFKVLYEQGRATLNRLNRRSSESYSSAGSGSSEGGSSMATSSENEDAFESCLEGAAWGAPLSPFAMEAHYQCIKQIIKHIKNKNLIKENNMEIIKIFTDETRTSSLETAKEEENWPVEKMPKEECDSAQVMLEEKAKFEEEATLEQLRSYEEEERCDVEENPSEDKKYDDSEKPREDEDELEPKIELKPKPYDEPKYKGKPPYPVKSFKLIWTARNLLDLSTNLLSNASMYIPARIPQGVPGYFENRSQISRMKGADPPPHTMLGCDCGFEESFFN